MVQSIPKPIVHAESSVRPAIHALQTEMVRWRRHLHQHPELGFEELLTAEFVARQLEQWGIEHVTGIAKTGIVATIHGSSPQENKPKRVFAVRADMDA
ncbi:MAG: amidohydrolase, partial [Cyanobacteria bacterium P01_F01_bin.42]